LEGPSARDLELAERLVAEGRLTREQLAWCVSQARARRATLEHILTEKGVLRREAPAASAARVGRYEVLGELGRGGMGVVYRARDPSLGRTVAVKMILDASQAGPEQVKRFQREATAAAKLSHPNIVNVYEVGEDGGRPFIAMELVDGASFESVLKKQRPPAKRTVEIVRDIARALAHAHENGVIHRDVKPENVIVDKNGSPHLMDFGLAREVSGGERMTVTGAVLGTPAYMAPEQAAGETADQGPRSDIYALGAVLYRALLGRPPHESSSIQQQIKKVLFDEPEAPRRLDPKIHVDLETIMLRCLAKEPERRYASAAEVAAELQRFLDGETIVARPVGRLERSVVWARRNRGLAATVAALALVVPSAVIVSVVLVRRGSAHEADAAAARASAHEQEDARAREKATRERADEAESLVRKAEDLVARGRLDEALSLLDKAEALDPKSTEVHYKRSVVYALGHDFPKVVKEMDRAIALDPSRAVLWAMRAGARERTGDESGALADYDRAVALDPKLVDARLGRAVLRRRKQDLDGALADLDEASRLTPRDERIWFEKGETLQLVKDARGALAAYEKAIECNQAYVLAWCGRATVKALLEDLKGAIEDDTHAIGLDARCHQAWGHRGQTKCVQGDYEGAVTDCSKAIDLAPDVAVYWCDRGRAQTSLKHDNEALADLTKAVELGPKLAEAWLRLGAARANLGRTDEALAAYDRSIELDPKSPAAYASRGMMRGRKHDRAGARADFEHFLELVPPDDRRVPAVKKFLAQLGSE
jgi:tetratricopeptide (TPR) repeat protein/predicted Ser/Thr protein kinase